MDSKSLISFGEAASSASRPATFWDTGDEDSILLTGSPAAITRQGVDIGDTFPGPRTFDERVTVRGADGHNWEVWGEEWCSMQAQRQRTPAERECYVDSLNARVSTGHFSIDRESMCKHIAWEISAVAAELSGDRIPPRAARRLMRKRLAVLAQVQQALTCREADMADLRGRLASVGIQVAQKAYLQ